MAPSSRVYPKLHQNIFQAMPENVTIVWEDSLDERARPRNQWIRQFRGGRYNAIVYSQE
ncbi:hypothetical protein MCOR17_011847, partial [Pyricularia oryzae]